MRAVKIVDITLRESEQLFASGLSFKQKIEIAKLLEKLKIDVIETGFVSEAPADAVLVRTLSTMLEGSAVCVPVSLDKAGIERAVAALSKAKKARLNLIVPVSTVQMEYVYKLKADTVVAQVGEMTALCASLCPDVEFTAEDATRGEPELLSAMLKAAISAGAKTVTLCDATGEKTPEELATFVEAVLEKTPELREVALSLHLRDNLGLAAAAALAAVPCGVTAFKVACGAAPGHLPLEQFINILKVRGEALDLSVNANVTALFRTMRQLDALTGAGLTSAGRPGRAAVFSADEESTSAAEALGADSDIAAVRRLIESLGYEVSEEDLAEIYRQFREVARNKKVDSRGHRGAHRRHGRAGSGHVPAGQLRYQQRQRHHRHRFHKRREGWEPRPGHRSGRRTHRRGLQRRRADHGPPFRAGRVPDSGRHRGHRGHGRLPCEAPGER